MLRSMREGAKSAPMKIFLVTLAIGFAMWGIDDVFRNVGSNDAAVKAGNHEITALEAAQEFDRTRRAYLPGANNTEAIAQGLLGDVLAGLARRAVFSAEADRMKLSVTREMEKKHIAGEPAFRDETGRFNLLRFQDALARAGINEEGYLNYIRNDLNSGQIFSALLPGVSYPESLSEAIAKWRLERRVIDYVTIAVDTDAQPQPSDAEIDAWYSENSETYNSPDLRSVTALVLSPDTLAEGIDISDADLRQAYDDQIDLYQTPERRMIRQMIFADTDAANQAMSRLNKGEAFGAVANDLLGLSEADTALGSLSRDDLSEELAEAAFSAEQGQAIGPVSTPLGQHVLMVEEILPENVTAIETVVDRIRDDLQRDRAIDLVYQRIAEVEDALASGSTLAETAAETGAELSQIDGMDRSGLDIDGNAIDGIAGDTKFRQSVWTANIGETGLVEETNADTFYVIEVNSEAPSAERTLADIKTRVIADMRREAAIEVARSQAETITEDQSGLADMAKAQGLSLETSPAMRRDGVSFDHEAARLIAGQAFGLDQGSKGFVETGDAMIVMTVTAIQSPEGEALVAETERLQESLSSNVATSLEGIIANGLIETHDVAINAGAVQTLLVGQTN